MAEKSDSLLFDDLAEPLSPGMFSQDDAFASRAHSGIWHLLALIVLASFLCMTLRSIARAEVLGILTWPVLFGFGVERRAGGHGVWGGTVGGLLAFGGAGIVLASIPLGVISLPAGACWGFYLSVWLYIIVETFLQSL